MTSKELHAELLAVKAETNIVKRDNTVRILFQVFGIDEAEALDYETAIARLEIEERRLLAKERSIVANGLVMHNRVEPLREVESIDQAGYVWLKTFRNSFHPRELSGWIRR